MIRHLAALFVLALPLTAQAEALVPESRAQIALSFAPVVRATTPAVVNIYAARVVPGNASPLAGDPFFSQFFRDRTAPRVQNSLGSGVIVDESGIVVSNFHVVGNAAQIRVVLSDRREFAAQVLLADEARDIAVLKLDTDAALPALEFADSDKVEVGDLVLAIGNPFGVGQTVTSGIVSALARNAGPSDGATGYLIQTDAAINPGNSGGALVDMQGRLLGLNTSILTRSGGSNGIGFAIPSNLVRAYTERARAGEAAPGWPWAGLAGQPADSGIAMALGLPGPGGLLVSELHPQSPFRSAGLRPGDLITAIDGYPVHSLGDLSYRMMIRPIGSEAQVSYMRDGTDRQATILLVAAPEDPPRNRRSVPGPGPLAGLTVETVNPAVIDALHLPLRSEGAVVREVPPLLDRLGLRAGDVIVGLNGHRIRASDDVATAAAPVRGVIDMVLSRGGRQLSLRFRV